MKDYFVYLPIKPTGSVWGCVTTGVGLANVLPNQPYPPRQHPLDHYFDWKKGRVLRSYQIILISAGSGVFECEAQRHVQQVEAGTVMVLFPGVWHRYQPTVRTGWVESWIECHGPVFDEAVRSGLIHPKSSLIKAGATSDLSDCFERCLVLAKLDAMGNQDLLSTLGLHMLSLLGHLQRSERGFSKDIDDVVQRAHMLIALRCQEPLDLPALAAELGVGYSNFRHNFTARVGISPRQHYLNTRIQKAQDLLVSTAKSVKEISIILGFESASHLSKQFKQRIGVSPLDWRTKFIRQRQASTAATDLKSSKPKPFSP